MINVRGALYEAVMHSGTHIDAPAQVVEGTVMPAGVDEFAKKKVKMIGSDTQALDDPLGPAGPRWAPLDTAGHRHRPAHPGWPNGLLPDINREYEREIGRTVIEDFPQWEPCHQAILKPSGQYRFETGK